MDNSLLLAYKLKNVGADLLSQAYQILSDRSDSELGKRVIPILLTLLEGDKISINELAGVHSMTHPAIVQIVNKLAAKDFISVKKSPHDKRITLVEITKKGRSEIQKIKPTLERIEESLNEVIRDIDSSLIYSLAKLEKFAKEKTLIKMANEKFIEIERKEIEIIPYNKKYKNDFKRLNYEWLGKYFVVEEEDKRVLSDPEKEIIKKGGEIFFALLNNKVVGTVAVQKIDKSTFELVKMAVTEKAQGKQIGKKLALICIGFAVEKKAKRLVLSTSTKLTAALNLYKTLGFETITMNDDKRYERELISMELKLIE